jgi:hypothetical protein
MPPLDAPWHLAYSVAWLRAAVQQHPILHLLLQ